ILSSVARYETLEFVHEDISAEFWPPNTVVATENIRANVVGDDSGIECVHRAVFRFGEGDTGDLFGHLLIEDHLVDLVPIVENALDSKIELAFDLAVFRTSSVLKHARTVLGGAALDQTTPTLDVYERSLDLGGVVADFDVFV